MGLEMLNASGIKMDNAQDTYRAFIAIELPSHVQQFLDDSIQRLQPLIPGPVKWAAAPSIHLTLKFLGATPRDLVPDIVRALRGLSERLSPVALRVGGLDCFPSPRRPQVLWMGVQGDIRGLGLVQSKIEETLEPLGFKRESRPFVAHLTLARFKGHHGWGGSRAPGSGPLEGLLARESAEGPSFIASKTSLIKSTLTPRGPIYESLAAIALGVEGAGPD